MNFLKKIFPSFNERKLNEYRKILNNVNEYYDIYIKNNPNPKEKTKEFIKRLENNEDIDSILPEAFALVKYVMYLLAKEHYTYSDKNAKIHFIWDMIPYDVQILGSIALHKGTIIEMATGEGKTLVAVMPLYLNALTKKGTYLITVNDYLAKRDRAWMKPIYDNLGVTVGLIQTGMTPEERRENYEMDIVYLTNNEFGFDYLRDNLTYQKKERVHRDEFYYAIIDEVDSVLIDEARTPLIISGLPMDIEDKEKTQRIYRELRDSVNTFVRKQKIIIEDIFKKAKEELNKNSQKAFFYLLQVKKGNPKYKPLIELMQNADIVQNMTKYENNLIRDKSLHLLDKDLLFSIDERGNSINITDKGEEEFSRIKGDKDFFVLPELATEFDKLDNSDLSGEEKIAKKEEINVIYSQKSEYIHAVNQLLKAYILFEKDVEYIVQNDKIIIVDEHTGRLMPGRRFSEGLHSAIEAKENVRIEEETRTLATITLQNLFRMFEKLSGMTGTAETEAKEFMHIYKLPVIVIPTNKPVIREDKNDVIFIRKEQKIKYIINKIVNIHNAGIPLLVGTASVASSEYLDKKLKTKKSITGKQLNYSILNAKNHEKEAEIVADAGTMGAITIATNMAGRGTDIKLKPEIKMLPERSALIQALILKEKNKKPIIIYQDEKSLEYIKYLFEHDSYLSDKKQYFSYEIDNKIPIINNDISDSEYYKLKIPPTNEIENRKVCIYFDENGECLEYASPGLYVLGTEKHESRRIDRQLRGRAGRQGDPGTSLFTVSLEDDLMRIFGSDKMSDLIKKLESMSGTSTAVSHKLLTSSIENAQKKIENLNFERRKYLLEYDDVINKQREVVYELRNFFLYKVPPFEILNDEHFLTICMRFTEDLKKAYSSNNIIQINKLIKKLNYIFHIDIQEHDIKEIILSNKLPSFLRQKTLLSIKEHLEEAKEYILENLPSIAEDFIMEQIQGIPFNEEWPIESINDFLMNYFTLTIKEPQSDISAKDFIEEIKDKIVKRIDERFDIPEEFLDKLLYVISMSFIRAIDKNWVEQLYELDAIKEGISLRSYAHKDPLVEFKKEAYILFSDLMDNIIKEFSKEFFTSKLLGNIEEIKKARIKAEKPVLFMNTSDNKRVKKQPVKKEHKKIGRNDPCPCGSGKKYKNCCGRNQ